MFRLMALSILLVFLSGADVVVAQPSVDVTVIADEHSLTVLVSGDSRVSLIHFGFEVVIDGTRMSRYLADYALFRQLDLSSLQAPICFRIERFTSTSPPPLECQNSKPLIEYISDVDVFWFDTRSQQKRVLFFTNVSDSNAYCSPAELQCTIVYTPPTATPTPVASSTPPPTNTPLPTPTPIPESSILHWEDFEDGTADGWDRIQWDGFDEQNWQVIAESDINKFYKIGPYSKWISVAFGSSDWTNYVLRFRMKFLNQGGLVVGFRAIKPRGNNESRYSFDIDDPIRGEFGMARIVEGQWDRLWDANYTNIFDAEGWNEIQITVQDDIFDVVVNGQYLAQLQDSLIKQGGIQFLVPPDTSVALDDVLVWTSETMPTQASLKYLYTEDFEDNSVNGWEQRYGDPYQIIEVSGNYVWQNIGGGEIILTESSNWQDYALMIDFYIAQWTGDSSPPSLSFKIRRPYLDYCNAYQATIYESQLVILSQQSGNCIGGEILGIPIAIDASKQEWHTLFVELNGTTIRWQLDNGELQEVHNADHSIGGISLVPHDLGEIWFDNIRVWSLEE